MEDVHNCKRVLSYNVVCFFVYLAFFFIGDFMDYDALSITGNTFFVVKLLCIIQILLGGIRCKLFYTEDKVKGWKKKIAKFVSQLTMLLICAVTFHIISVLYGAPFFESVSETFHFSFLLATFSLLDSILSFSKSWSHWLAGIFSASLSDNVATRSMAIACISTIIGAWLGAFPIPLDWDRPWQVWPISCIYGSVLGRCFGLLAGSVEALSGIVRAQRAPHQKSKSKRV